MDVEALPESRDVVEFLHPPEDAVDPVVDDPLPDPGLDRPGDCEIYSGLILVI